MLSYTRHMNKVNLCNHSKDMLGIFIFEKLNNLAVHSFLFQVYMKQMMDVYLLKTRTKVISSIYYVKIVFEDQVHARTIHPLLVNCFY